MSYTIPNLPASPTTMQAAQSAPDSGDFSIIALGMQGSGVVSGCAVTANNNLLPSVAAGIVRSLGKIKSVTGGTVTIGTADATNPRFDMIVANSSGTKAVRAGTASANPVFPALTAGDVVLAAVYVPATATSIATANLVDKRVLLDQQYASGLYNVKDYGALGDGGTDDTTAIQAAITDAIAAGGGVVYFPSGSYKTTAALTVTSQNITFRGTGLHNCRIYFLPADSSISAACVILGTFDRAMDYNCTGNAQGFQMEDMTINGTYDATQGATYTTGSAGSAGYVLNTNNHTYGIVDYEGGGLLLKNAGLRNCYTGFWGAGSDINRFMDCFIFSNNVGIELHWACDQQLFSAMYFAGCNDALRLYGPQNVYIDKPLFVENIGYDILVTNEPLYATAALQDPLSIFPTGGSTPTAINTNPTTGNAYVTGIGDAASSAVTLIGSWHEVGRNNKFPGGLEWAVGQPTRDAFIKLDSGSQYVPTRDFRVINAYVVAINDRARPVANAFIHQNYAQNTVVDGLTVTQDGWFPILKTDVADTVNGGGAIIHNGDATVTNIVYRDGTSYAGSNAGHQGVVISPMHDIVRTPLRKPMILNGTLAGSGPTYWTLSAATIASYTLTGGENSLGGTPKTLTPTSQFGGMVQQFPGAMRNQTAYECILRYKAAAPATTLSAAITTTNGTSMTVASATGFPTSGNYDIKIDNEQLTVTAGQGTTTWTVTRGVNSAVQAATHLNAAAVTLLTGQWQIKVANALTGAAPNANWTRNLDYTSTLREHRFTINTRADTISPTTTANSSTAITGTGGTSLSVASAALFPGSGNYNIQIDSEIYTVTGGQGTTTWTVTRGVNNTTAATHSVGATVTLLTSPALTIYFLGASLGTQTMTIDYVDLHELTVFDAGSVDAATLNFYDIGGDSAGVPTASAVIYRFICPRAFTLKSAGALALGTVSQATAATHPSSTTSAFNIQKNGTTYASFTIGTGGTPTWTNPTADTAIVAGDILTVTAPATLNGVGDISFTLVGVLS